MNRLLSAILLLVTIFFVFVGILNLLGFTTVAMDFARLVNRYETRIVSSSIVLVIIITSCIVAAGMAKRRGRSAKLWIFICFFFNWWGVLILYFLPPIHGARMSHLR